MCIVGAPHSGSWGSQRVMHHTLGKAGDLDFELSCYKQVTCYQVGGVGWGGWVGECWRVGGAGWAGGW